jgi:heme/copper-type cytochrome/quinol oxidase subunit 2
MFAHSNLKFAATRLLEQKKKAEQKQKREQNRNRIEREIIFPSFFIFFLAGLETEDLGLLHVYPPMRSDPPVCEIHTFTVYNCVGLDYNWYFSYFCRQGTHVGRFSAWYGASSSCGWRRWPPDMEGSCEYIE